MRKSLQYRKGDLKKPQLEKAGRKLYGPGQYPLRVLGQFNGKLSYNGKQSIETSFVVAGLRTNLLSLPAHCTETNS